WLVTLSLCFSIIVDVTITATLAFLLLIKTRGRLEVGNQVMVLTNINGILDSLILYTLELGSITGFTSIVILICWLRLDHMIFIGLFINLPKRKSVYYAAYYLIMLDLHLSPWQLLDGNVKHALQFTSKASY
ncbi:hypothetical protein JOM56_014498, partial [Amanita muscaria]